MQYKDFTFNKDNLNAVQEVDQTSSIILAIKNIILSKPGNFPFTPELGLNIEKYQFEIMDDITLSTIKTELDEQIAKYIPNIAGCETNVSYINLDDNSDTKVLCISVMPSTADGQQTLDILTYKDKNGNLKIINELR